ncbi:hypothetical protein ABT126_25805 [Streptomyces sp. NPDC002012]|uniref:hypothetical protein n=1 Tax=Streptomyces sp. NPDC002012 TaxID=3154532 RepID=UPI00332FC08F
MSTSTTARIAQKARPTKASPWPDSSRDSMARRRVVRTGRPALDEGVRCEAVLQHLGTLTEGEPGPVVREIAGSRWTYFLIPPGSSKEYDWPPGARCFGPPACDQYVGVPAPDGNTYPLSWRCGAPREGEFVDVKLLYGLVMAQLAPEEG